MSFPFGQLAGSAPVAVGAGAVGLVGGSVVVVALREIAFAGV
ncbi:hypothetical protein ACBJ59_53035 [Nonomuraea sp. MTCD27]